MNTPIYPSCGCSLVRLGVELATAKTYEHAGARYSFCCRGCLDLFVTEPEKYIREIADGIVCPACLAEKHLDSTVTLEYQGETVNFCRCPGCQAAFQRDPDRLLRRLTGTGDRRGRCLQGPICEVAWKATLREVRVPQRVQLES